MEEDWTAHDWQQEENSRLWIPPQEEESSEGDEERREVPEQFKLNRGVGDQPEANANF